MSAQRVRRIGCWTQRDLVGTLIRHRRVSRCPSGQRSMKFDRQHRIDAICGCYPLIKW